jgi:PKD domain/Inosine-uridine preferring nucleoside hydrolase
MSLTMTTIRNAVVCSVPVIGLSLALLAQAQTPPDRDPPRIPESTHNLLLDAKVSGNLESYQKGRRGAADQVVYDVARGRFGKESQWHEYGVGMNEDLGIVLEDKPAYWLAEWPQPVEANFIVLSGVYPNQPQPDTAWKIELRRDGQWTTHARGVGGWYDRGRYVWGNAATEPVKFDALRVSVFSKDAKTPLKSIHFRGEEKVSWLVAQLAPIDARIAFPREPARAGQPVQLTAETVAGQIKSWRWDFGGGAIGEGQTVTHTFPELGDYSVALTFSDGTHSATVRDTIPVLSPVQVEIVPLTTPVMAGRAVGFIAQPAAGTPTSYTWDFGDGQNGQGAKISHTFSKPGIYQVKVTAAEGRFSDDCLALVRAHTAETLHVPQVLLDTDAKNEQDDQHYLGYGLFSELDVLGINSTHHGGGQEPINYAEILHVIELAKQSGLPAHRVPPVFHGANQRLKVPPSGDWRDTEPVVTAASEAILSAARGASPDSPVWIVPVGPGSNPASAILQARREGLELKGRIRVMWLGGSNDGITREFNGNNDPWSMYVIAQSGIETWIMPAPVGARVAINKATEGDLYADHPLGQYLKQIVPAKHKALFDPSCLSAIISERLSLGWVKETEFVTVAGPSEGYRWTKAEKPGSVRLIRQIDQKAMQMDLFNSMKGRPTKLVGVSQPQ